MVTKDLVKVYTAMRVYGINPWGDIEVLYVGFNTEESETSQPHEATGAGRCTFKTRQCVLYVGFNTEESETSQPHEATGAGRCTFKTRQCYANRGIAESLACTYIEDEEGFLHPPQVEEPTNDR